MTRTQLALRVVMLLTPTLALVAAGTPPLWQVLLALLLGGLAWRRPDSLLGVGVLALVGWRWASVADGGIPLVAMVSVVCLVAFEVASVLASYGPPELDLEAALLRLWIERAVVMLAPAAVVLLLGRLVVESEGSAVLWFIGVAGAVLALVVLRGALRLPESSAD